MLLNLELVLSLLKMQALWTPPTHVPSHTDNITQRAYIKKCTVQEKEAISGVAGGYGWLVVQRVLKGTNLPFVLIPKNGVS